MEELIYLVLVFTVFDIGWNSAVIGMLAVVMWMWMRWGIEILFSK